MLRRNVKFTPLPGFGDVEALDVVAALPEMALFSSDYPHLEGNADPINLYGERLRKLDAELPRKFLGRNATEAFGRMGDPLCGRPVLSRRRRGRTPRWGELLLRTRRLQDHTFVLERRMASQS